MFDWQVSVSTSQKLQNSDNMHELKMFFDQIKLKMSLAWNGV